MVEDFYVEMNTAVGTVPQGKRRGENIRLFIYFAVKIVVFEYTSCPVFSR